MNNPNQEIKKRKRQVRMLLLWWFRFYKQNNSKFCIFQIMRVQVSVRIGLCLISLFILDRQAEPTLCEMWYDAKLHAKSMTVLTVHRPFVIFFDGCFFVCLSFVFFIKPGLQNKRLYLKSTCQKTKVFLYQSELFIKVRMFWLVEKRT